MSSPASTPRSQRSRRGADSPAPVSPAPPARQGEKRKGAQSPKTPQSHKKRATRNGGGSEIDVEPSAVRTPLRAVQQAAAAGDSSLFTSPARARPQLPGTSEMDVSSPLNYGTPSSKRGQPRSPATVGTPIRLRADIHSERHMRTVNLGGTSEMDSSRLGAADAPSENNSTPFTVFWGTDVSLNECKQKFKRFLERFIDLNLAQDERFEGMNINEPVYIQRLEEINTIGEPFLDVNCEHVNQFDQDLYRQLVCYPQEAIPVFDMAASEVFFTRYPDTTLEHQIQVRPYNSLKTKNMRALNPEDIDQLITIHGMVTRTSSLIPELREAFFACNICQNTVTVEIERGRISEPTLCQNCNTTHSFQLVHNRSRFTDKQIVKLQESPDDMPAGQTPHTVLVFAHDDLVDKVQPGDRVTVTGVYRATPLRTNPRQRTVKAVYKTHMDVVHYRKLDTKRLRETSGDDDGKELQLTQERIRQVKALSSVDGIYERLASAVAPSIYEHIDIKKGILMQLFGGTRKDFSETGRGKFRAELNILLCGDPGTSKSQLLQYVYNLVPRGQYTSGKGSSAVGLTAYVLKDPETKQLVLQTGALVLSDNGVCCIDEFDKMNDSTRAVLHEVMEQQTLSIAKAGIICQLNARASVLAAANPVESQWNKNKTIIENIQLPHTLLSRFDLIFLMLDPQDELFDRRLAKHLISLYYRTEAEEEEELMDMGLLKDYIGYARSYVHPKISEKAGQSLIEAYVDMRKVGSGRGQVSAYPRQLESLIRLSEAHARMRLSDVVEVKDVDEARRLHREALKQAAVDPTTGKIDVSILTTGVSGAARKQHADRVEILRALIKAKGRVPSIKATKLFEEFREKIREKFEQFATKEMFDDARRDLEDDGEIVTTGNVIRPVAT